MVKSLSIIFASTSGHTEYVVDTAIDYLSKKAKNLKIEKQRCELAKPEDFTKCDALLLACATWNMWGMEGHLNPIMYDLLAKRAKEVDLKGMPVGHISLGESKYYYTGRATEHLMQYTMTHGGKPTGIPLLVVDDPYGQEDKVQRWAQQFLEALQKL